MVHRLKLSHGSDQSPANCKWLLESLTLPFKHAFSMFHGPLLFAPPINDLLAHRPHKGQPLRGCTCLGCCSRQAVTCVVAKSHHYTPSLTARHLKANRYIT